MISNFGHNLSEYVVTLFVLGGGIIAVGYEARARGVSRRNMRGDDAKSVCPDIKLFSVPEVRGR